MQEQWIDDACEWLMIASRHGILSLGERDAGLTFLALRLHTADLPSCSSQKQTVTNSFASTFALTSARRPSLGRRSRVVQDFFGWLPVYSNYFCPASPLASMVHVYTSAYCVLYQ